MTRWIDNPATDTWFNLAAEEYLLKHFDDDLCMVWQNEPSVIIGKHQNVWDEINQPFLLEQQIKVVRRYSGGGAVYHDKGNLNITFIENGNRLRSGSFTLLLVAFLETLGIRALADERQGLTIDGLKISGSAQSVHKRRLLHHATLLFSTNLHHLTTALQNRNKEQPKERPDNKPYYVTSVRSPVTNICSHLRTPLTVREFKQALLDFLIRQHPDAHPYSFNTHDIEAIGRLSNQKYATADWNFNLETKHIPY